ncbi:Short-chain dehydrogenase/reductase family protein [Mycena sanguinolenta]|uniref:Short-chain dehydrogenase/reductase family protein n=1 Tax=Mycena sanguinolenta TaxID=230812 RepID=A0A8H6YZK8_9AGAR|nr:Short-chain dehydrogenase/reductase family protein [Mycena sanguinolenta]
MLRSIHLNPVARVYTLRALLGAAISLVIWSVINVEMFGIVCGIVILLHHILAAFKWTLRGLALIDLLSVLAEFSVLLHFSHNLDPFSPICIAPLIFLFFSGFFRIATIVYTREGFLIQQFRFLGRCTQSNPPYNTASILLNRSLARPLVRGESKYIIIARALVLSCLWIGVPAFGIYATVLKPAAAVISTTLVDMTVDDGVPGNATIYVASDTYNSSPWEIVVTAIDLNSRTIDCPTIPGDMRAICPWAWTVIQSISMSAVVPSEPLYVPFIILALPADQCQYFTYSPKIDGLQPNISAPANITSLTLLQYSGYPIKYFRDTADASALSGIATFGGFWTFVNGTFALFFGANVVYFAFGRRPLSALGVVHLFQRRSLVRRWHEDFPALHTEGGLPGSENAGIVAFIRERLVDVGEDPRDIEQKSRIPKRRPKNGRFRRLWGRRKGPQLRVPNHMREGHQATSQESQEMEQMLSSYPDIPLDKDSWEDVDEKVDHDLPTVPPTYPRRGGYILDEVPV